MKFFIEITQSEYDAIKEDWDEWVKIASETNRASSKELSQYSNIDPESLFARTCRNEGHLAGWMLHIFGQLKQQKENQ